MFELLYVSIDFLHFARNVYALGTVFHTFVASDAVVGLTQTWHSTVISYKEGAAQGSILRIL